MKKKVNAKEVAAVSALAANERYGYFVRQVADWEAIWSLKNDEGWVVMGDDNGNELMPVWPHEQFAAACKTEAWKDAEPTPIPLDRWLAAWTPGLTSENRQVAVFPTPDDQSVVVTAERLQADLLEEVEQYE